jgi:cytoskeletal protein CcmA (bactofilin family)
MNDVNTLVGRGSHFDGKMTFEGTVRIDGSFDGEIVSEDALIIGEGAEVRAELDVATVIIYGTVYGNIRASNSVELHGPGRLVGNLITPSLIVAKGAIFDGNCRMGAIEWADDDASEKVVAQPEEAPESTNLTEVVASLPIPEAVPVAVSAAQPS